MNEDPCGSGDKLVLQTRSSLNAAMLGYSDADNVMLKSQWDI